MGGFFAVASKENCVLDLFFTAQTIIHISERAEQVWRFTAKPDSSVLFTNIQNSPFRTKFETDVNELDGNLGIGCISDFEPQPLIVHSHLGSYAITTVGRINNAKELMSELFENGFSHFLEMSEGNINPTEIAAALINRQASIPEGIQYLQSRVRGSLTVLVLTSEGVYAARDLLGRTPVVLGKKPGACCAAF